MWKHFWKVFGLSLSLLILLCGLTFTLFGFYLRDKYYPGVNIAGVDLAFSSKVEAQTRVSALVQSYLDHPVSIHVPDLTGSLDTSGQYPTVEIKTTAATLGLQLDSEQVLEQAWTANRSYSPSHWVPTLVDDWFHGADYTIPYRIDQTAILTFINTSITPKITNPTPAKLRIEGDQVLMDQAKPGLAIDTQKLAIQVSQTIAAISTEVDAPIIAEVQITTSPVTEAILTPLVSQLTRLSALKLSLSSGTISFVPSKSELLQWFTPAQDSGGSLSLELDTTKLNAFLKAKGGKQLDLTLASKAVVSELKTVMKESVTNQVLSSRNLTLAQKAVDPLLEPKPTALGLTGKHIEVNLAQQRLYQMEGDAVIKTYIISSGAWATPTPKGTFTIASKSKRAYSSSYGLYMPNWMNFVGTPDGVANALPVGMYGLHELPEWPNGYKEGQSHLGTPVSHGCVRLGVGDASEVYAWTDIGTVVTIH